MGTENLEARDELTAELREEFAPRYEHDKGLNRRNGQVYPRTSYSGSGPPLQKRKILSKRQSQHPN